MKITIEKSQGEFRVPSEDGYEDGAHYTNDKEDAIAVAKKVFGDDVQISFRSVSEFVGGKYEKYRPKTKNESLNEKCSKCKLSSYNLNKNNLCPDCQKTINFGKHGGYKCSCGSDCCSSKKESNVAKLIDILSEGWGADTQKKQHEKHLSDIKNLKDKHPKFKDAIEKLNYNARAMETEIEQIEKLIKSNPDKEKEIVSLFNSGKDAFYIRNKLKG